MAQTPAPISGHNSNLQLQSVVIQLRGLDHDTVTSYLNELSCVWISELQPANRHTKLGRCSTVLKNGDSKRKGRVDSHITRWENSVPEFCSRDLHQCIETRSGTVYHIHMYVE